MSPAGERPVPVATKKSLRIWIRNNGHVKRKQRETYVYPRTVEAAKDPSVCSSGKNKMFFLIAINLFPDSKIVKPDESDTESEVTEQIEESPTKSIEMKQPTNLKRKVSTKKSKKIAATAQRDNSLQTMTDPLDGDKISETDKQLSADENASQHNVPPVASKAKAKRKATQRNGRYSKVLKRSNENEEAALADPPVVPNCSKDVMKKASPSKLRQGAPPAIPNIVSSLNEIIRNCSETGLISFNLANEPTQSR